MVGFASYRIADGLIEFLHTQIDVKWSGQGLAGELIRFRSTMPADTAWVCCRTVPMSAVSSTSRPMSISTWCLPTVAPSTAGRLIPKALTPAPPPMSHSTTSRPRTGDRGQEIVGHSVDGPPVRRCDRSIHRRSRFPHPSDRRSRRQPGRQRRFGSNGPPNMRSWTSIGRLHLLPVARNALLTTIRSEAIPSSR